MTRVQKTVAFASVAAMLVLAAGCGEHASGPDPSVVARASTYKPAPGPNPGLAVMQQYKAVENMTPEQRASYYKSHPGSDGPGPMPKRRDE